MSISVIINQGRVGDRAAGMALGARLTGEALAKSTGAVPTVVGEPHAVADDDWTVALPQASQTLVQLRARLDAELADGNFPFVLSSTCSASLATLPVVHSRYDDVVVLYIDGHGDFNTPTTGSGYLGGMVLSNACGLWDSGFSGNLPPRQAVLIGSRDIDEEERRLIGEAGVHHLPPSEATPSALAALIGHRPVWVHVDWDVMEPGFVPADYVVPGGLLPNGMRELFEVIPTGQLVGVELAEFNASGNDASDADALAVITDVTAPLQRIARAQSRRPEPHSMPDSN